MNSLNEISNFIDTIELGDPIYSIQKDYSSDISICIKDWQAKQELRDSNNWLKQELASKIRRKFDRDLNKMKLIDKEDTVAHMKYFISTNAAAIVLKTSPAEQPKRTKMYKEIADISYDNRSNDNFVNDLIPIANYYYSHVKNGTDSIEVHKKNVFGLLDILRKKYANKTSN